MTRVAPVGGRGFLRGGSPSGPSTPVTVPDRPGPVSVGGDERFPRGGLRAGEPHPADASRNSGTLRAMGLNAAGHRSQVPGGGTEVGQGASIASARLALARIARWMAWAWEAHYHSTEATL